MCRIKIVPLVAVLAVMGSGLSQAQNTPSADEVLRFVRYSHTQYNRNFEGSLRSGIKRVDFVLSLQPSSIRYIFNEPAQVVQLNTQGGNFSLLEGVGGSAPKPVPAAKYGENIRGTDVTYDDLSMRFLYWPNGKIIRAEKFKARDCWLVRVTSPDNRGAYATVDIWIDQENHGMLRMVGYNRGGQQVRRFEVLHAKKFDDAWMVDDMRIDTFKPGNNTPTSSTRMQIRAAIR